jgi:hypothetical protein
LTGTEEDKLWGDLQSKWGEVQEDWEERRRYKSKEELSLGSGLNTLHLKNLLHGRWIHPKEIINKDLEHYRELGTVDLGVIYSEPPQSSTPTTLPHSSLHHIF